MSPTVRLIVRAVLAGVVTAGTQLQQATSWNASLVAGACVGAVLAASEVLTPLNPAVGVAKQ